MSGARAGSSCTPRCLLLCAALCIVWGSRAVTGARTGQCAHRQRSALDYALYNVSRHHGGDFFTVTGPPGCCPETCVGISSGSAGLATSSDEDETGCLCRCHEHLPTFREDLKICIDDINECSLAPFVSASTSQKIPFVFLPLRGQIVHPSREIRFEGIQTAICAVAGAQYLSRTGWNEVRNPLDMDVPFRLFRDDGRTYLQWLGESDLRSRLEGRLVLVNLMCRDTAPRKDNAPTPTTGEIFTPCVAFRVVGTPAKHITNVSEVVFAPDARSTEAAVSGAGLGMDEYIAIGISSVLLGSIYVASVFLYLHLKRRRQKKEEEIEQQHQQQIQQVQPLSHHLDKSVIKNNPLLGLSTRY